MVKLNFGDIDRFVLFGGGSLLIHTATKLTKEGYVVSVFSAKRHLNEETEGRCLITLLRDNNIDYYESLDINNDVRVVGNISNKTIGLSTGAAWIFKKDFIKHFGGKLINMHGTRLPQYRGGGGYSWQILRQNRLGCCLIHQIDSGVDTGNIIKYEEFIYPNFCKVPADFADYHLKKNIAFFDKFVNEIKNKKDFSCISQPEYLSSYWPRLNTHKQGFVDWNWRLKDIECFINAFDEPYIGASTFINDDKRVFLKECYADYNDGRFHPFQTGIVYRKGDKVLFVATNEGTLILKKVFAENNRNIIGSIKVGERFFTPLRYLEEAKVFRATYTSLGLKDNRKGFSAR